MQEGFIRSSDGVRLFQRQTPTQDIRARVLLTHGYAEHCDRYQEVAQHFASRGFETWTYDLRGHGESEGSRGFVRAFDEYLLDMDAILAHLGEQDSKSKPLFLVSHSMGALVTVRWLQVRGDKAMKQHGVVAVLLSAPYLALKLKIAGVKKFAAHCLSGLVPKFTLPNELKASDLTRDPKIQEIWSQDKKLVTKVPARWFTEALKAQDLAFRDCSLIRCPIHMEHGSADPVADPEATQRFHDALQGQQKSLKMWPGLMHEIFNEVERQEVYESFSTKIESFLS